VSTSVEMDGGMKAITVSVKDGAVEIFAADGYYWPTGDELAQLIAALIAARDALASA
jgi:hypothetical protein